MTGFYIPVWISSVVWDVISFLLGALVACMTGGTFASIPFLNIPFFIGPINGIVVAMVLYVILIKALSL